jgi:hypothetical protein
MTRRSMALAVAMAASLLIPGAALASTPFSYHTISSKSAVATFSRVDGHFETVVYVGTSDARMSLKPGAAPIVGRSGLTTVDIIVSDLDQPTGKGYVQVAQWSGQIPLIGTFRGSLATASVTATIPVTERLSGDTGTATLHVTWVATSRASTAPRHMHLRWPHLLILVSNSNDKDRTALAVGTVSLDGGTLIQGATDSSALLLWTRFNCRQMGYRQVADFGECI